MAHVVVGLGNPGPEYRDTRHNIGHRVVEALARQLKKAFHPDAGALIAWYATERRIAPLSEIARRLRRDPSTLSVGISRYRHRRADLFDLERLHDLVPLTRS